MSERIGPYELNQICPFHPNSIAHGHALELARLLPDNSIDAIITSPPYFGLRDYGLPPALWPAVTFAPMAGLPEITIPEQEASLGLEADLWAYVGHLVALFRELRRGLKGTGSCWVNLGDSYAASRSYQVVDNKHRDVGNNHGSTIPAGLKPKDLLLIPHRVALALQADGWYLRSDIPWLKRNGMPGSQQDRPTVAKEYWFLLSKSERYYFDLESIKVPYKQATHDRIKYSSKGKDGAEGVVLGRKTNPNCGLAWDGEKELEGAGRSRRDSDWFFDSLRAILDDNAQILLASEEGEPLALTVNPVGYKAAHFATFPPALVTPLVLASTSERGCCPECGKPWVRVVEREGGTWQERKDKDAPTRYGLESSKGTPGNRFGDIASTTTGWQPTCAHDLEPVPAVILDPFMGSGTVGKEAARNRRRYLGFELNEDYLGLAEDRATVQVEMF